MPSTVIAGISYDASTKRLRITFVTEMIYNYKEVSEEVTLL